MEQRTLTITVGPQGWAGLRDAARAGFAADHYLGEILNFESPALFFSRMSGKRWDIVRTLQGAGEISVRELARRLGRDVKRVHEDVTALAELGLLERTERGGVVSPYADIHVDMHIRQAA
ncbi:MAG: winged helix-turn-helix transcriptional regulator [Thiomonas sp.]|uniref:HVO_A0114 family putative DNA-binding protein n=1 Tax=Thiomonas sp. TaxID=2047785 RepID=UPI002A3682FC|nr:winged helix-turn-helix transcriptional regulator [Thiomonas sp.]MDY0330929.1 winged helix-turn-helix transcriptional regulator [Thiomonas sp.]